MKKIRYEDLMAFDYASVSEAATKLRGRDGLAFDFKTSRSYTPEGHLHVEQSNISKANVSPYRGSEIPRWQELGLDPEKVYQLLRDPEELRKGAETFNNKPLLNRHVPVTADEHDPELVVGNVSNVNYEHPYLKGDLGIWRRDAIDDVEAKTKHQLSSAYRYIADMTPGVYQGAPYDGVMRNIVGNHVAQVKDGRAGDDVVVGDEDIAEDERKKWIVKISSGDVEEIYADTAEAAKAKILSADPGLKIISVKESKGRRGEDSNIAEDGMVKLIEKYRSRPVLEVSTEEFKAIKKAGGVRSNGIWYQLGDFYVSQQGEDEDISEDGRVLQSPSYLRHSIMEMERQYKDADGSAKERIKSDIDYAKRELARAISSGGDDEDIAEDISNGDDVVKQAKSFGTSFARDTGKDIGDLKQAIASWSDDAKKAAIDAYKALRGSANDCDYAQDGTKSASELRASILELERQYGDAEGSAKERIKSDLDYAKKELARANIAQDSKENVMTKKVLSRTAVALQGALAVYLQPKLAMDAKPVDIAGLLATVSAKSFKKDKPKLIKAIGKAVEGKLAHDADIGDLAKALDAFKPEDVVEGNDLDASSGLPVVEKDDDMDEDDVNADADPMARVMQFLKGKIADEDLAQVASMCQATDEDPDKKPPGATDAEDPKEKEKDVAKDKDEEKVTKKEMEGAMDAALKKNTRETETRVIARMQGIAEAKAKVSPLVGELNMAFDSADGVFIHALKADKVEEDDLEGLNTKALGLLVDGRIALKAAGAKTRNKIDVAMDSKTSGENFAKRYPNAGKIELGVS